MHQLIKHTRTSTLLLHPAGFLEFAPISYTTSATSPFPSYLATSVHRKFNAGQQPTVSCGDIITECDGDDSGLWCVLMKTSTKPSVSVAFT